MDGRIVEGSSIRLRDTSRIFVQFMRESHWLSYCTLLTLKNCTLLALVCLLQYIEGFPKKFHTQALWRSAAFAAN